MDNEPPVNQPVNIPPDSLNTEAPGVEQQQLGAPSPVPTNGPKSSKKKLIFSIIVLLILTAGVAVYALQHHKSKTISVPSSQTTSNTTTPELLTYVNVNKSKDLIVTDAQQNILGTLTMPDGKDTFNVLANNGQRVLVEASYLANGADSNSIYFLIDKNGKITQLPMTAASTIRSIVVGGAFLGNNNNYFYVVCGDTACNLTSLDLSTAGKTSVDSTPFSGSTSVYGTSSSMILVGLSSNDVAYSITYSDAAESKGTTLTGSPRGTPGSLRIYDINAKRVLNTLALDSVSLNPPSLSPDNKKLIYSTLPDGPVSEIMDTSSGVINKVPTPDRASQFFWSLDSTKVAFVGNRATFDASDKNKSISLEYVDLASSKAVSLKSYGDPTFNTIDIGGWSSGTQLDYVYIKTPTANDFRNGTSLYYTIDTTTQSEKQKPALNGYSLISANSF